MTRFILIIFLLLGVSYSLKANSKDDFRGISDEDWAYKLNGLFIAEEYEEVAKYSFDYYCFEFQNDYGNTQLLYNDKGEIRLEPFWLTIGLKQSIFYRSSESCNNKFEAEIYYLGACAFYQLADRAYDKEKSQIIHFHNDGLYNGNSCRLSYSFIAYVFAGLSADYIQMELSIFKKDCRSYASAHCISLGTAIKEVHRMYSQLSECLKIRYMFDDSYYVNKLPLMLYADFNTLPKYYLMAQKSKHTYNRYMDIHKDHNRFVRKYKDVIFEDKLDMFAFESTNSAVGWRQSFNYLKNVSIPECMLELQNLGFSSEMFIVQKVRKISALIARYNNLVYTMLTYGKLKAEVQEKSIILGLNALITQNVNDLFLRGADIYEEYRNVSWEEVRSKLGRNDYCVQFFETTSGKDRELAGYVFSGAMSSPQLHYFGHSYWSDSDAFDSYSLTKILPSAENIYYVGFPHMELRDAEKLNIDIHRLHSLAELCMTPPKFDECEKNYLIADLDFMGDSNNKILSKGLSDVYADFDTDSKFVNFFRTTFDDGCVVNDVVQKEDFFALSGSKFNTLHISTHGLYDKELEETLNQVSPYSASSGTNTLASIKLALSGYNVNIDNYISAYEISLLDLRQIDLVFLSTCHSGDGRIGVALNRSSSLSKAFHIAGVRNIISFFDQVEEIEAYEFSKMFYTGLAAGLSYHDAFYAAKAVFPETRVVMWE